MDERTIPQAQAEAGAPADEAERTVKEQADADAAEEVTRLRERLAFYESFDSLIQDNIKRSSDLLQEAASQRDLAARELAGTRAEQVRRLAAQREVLEAVGSELANLESSVASMVARVNASLERLSDSALGNVRGETTGAFQESVPPGEGTTVNVADDESEERLDEGPRPAAGLPAPDADVAGGQAAALLEAVADGEVADVIGGGLPQLGELGAGSQAGPADVSAAKRRRIDVVIHGVPKAATALSIQRHLQELEKVDAVEVREYVSGVLRFQVQASEFGPDDVRGWDGGEGLETVTSSEGVLELKLPTAEGF